MPSQRATQQAEALGRQLLNTILSLVHEGLETGDSRFIRAAYAPVKWEEHANPTFRQFLLKHLKIRLFTLTSTNPLMASRLVPHQWIEIKPEDVEHVQGRIAEMRMAMGDQLNELVQENFTPESREGP